MPLAFIEPFLISMSVYAVLVAIAFAVLGHFGMGLGMLPPEIPKPPCADS